MPLLLPLASKRSRAAARDPAAQRAVPMSNFFAETSDQPHVAGATLLRDHARLLALSGAAAIAFSSTLVRLSKASASTAAIFRCAYALPTLAFLAYREDRRFGSRTWRERRPALISGVFFARRPDPLAHLDRGRRRGPRNGAR